MSADQLAQAFPHPQVEYRCELAEQTSLADRSVDLVTVAATLHWLDLSAFYREVTRVLRPGGVFAAWTYGTHVEATQAIEAVIVHYMRDVLGPYTRPELQLVFRRYGDLPLPFPEVTMAPVAIEVEWTLPQLVGLLNTWSSAVEYRRQHGHLATDTVLLALTAAWAKDRDVGDAAPLRLPLYTRVARSVG